MVSLLLHKMFVLLLLQLASAFARCYTSGERIGAGYCHVQRQQTRLEGPAHCTFAVSLLGQEQLTTPE
jgi:hypothetical protein